MSYQLLRDFTQEADTALGAVGNGTYDTDAGAPANEPNWRIQGGRLVSAGYGYQKQLLFTGLGKLGDVGIKALFPMGTTCDLVVRHQGTANVDDNNTFRKGRTVHGRYAMVDGAPVLGFYVSQDFGNIPLDSAVTFANGYSALPTSGDATLELIPLGTDFTLKLSTSAGVLIASTTYSINPADAIAADGYIGFGVGLNNTNAASVKSVSYDMGGASATALTVALPDSLVVGQGATVTVSSDAPVESDTVVDLTAVNGTLSAASVTLTPDGAPPTVQFTPSALGLASVSATADDLASGSDAAIAMRKGATLGMIGDSLVARPEITGDLARLLQTATGSPRKVTLVNEGQSGRTSTDWTLGGEANLLTTAIGHITAQGATVLAIGLGANDSKTAVATSKATFKANLRAILDYAFAHGITKATLWKAPTPLIGYDYVGSGYNPNHDWGAGSAALIAQYHQAMDELAAEDRRVVASSGAAWYALSASPSGLGDDKIHPADDALGSASIVAAERAQSLMAAAGLGGSVPRAVGL